MGDRRDRPAHQCQCPGIEIGGVHGGAAPIGRNNPCFFESKKSEPARIRVGARSGRMIQHLGLNVYLLALNGIHVHYMQ